MKFSVDLFLLSFLGVSMVFAEPPLIVDENVLVVPIQRHGDDIDYCRPREVCADIFNFTRDHGNGTGRLESRFLQNCICPGSKQCALGNGQLLFKETLKQSMVVCEDASDFDVCKGNQIAKEQHNLGNYVYYKINCVCPSNENPGNFRNKMTVAKYRNEMTWAEKLFANENPRFRFFKCRHSRHKAGY